MDTGLRDTTALVLGASSGIGLATARSLASEGAHVVLVGRRGDRVRAEADALPSAVGVEADLLADDAPAAVVSAAEEAFGPVDVLVLNGGGPPPGDATEVTDAQVGEAVHQLVVQHQRVTSLVLPGMRQRGWGRIVAVGSSGVQQPIGRLALSNIGRAALAGYLKTLAGEVAGDGVTVNMVLPGRIDTDRVAQLDEANATRTGSTAAQVRAGSESAIPVGRYGDPAELAAVVTFLSSTAASYVNGEQVRCDGGMVRAH